jgi:hypothetical protein
MKAIIAALFLVTSINAVATERGNPLTGSSASSNASAGAIASTGNSSASGSNGGNDTNFIALPSTTSAVATSGNAGVICPLITVVSEASQVLFGLHSKSEIGVKPARVNFVCALYHNAVATGKPEDWKAFVDYAKEQDDLAKAK